MFRKPKKNVAKAGIRKRKVGRDKEENDDDVDETDLKQALQEAKEDGQKRSKSTHVMATSNSKLSKEKVMHQFETSKEQGPTQRDLATSTNEYHPTTVKDRGNPFLAGPIKAPTNIRTTCRFDYQPDVCKDYKDTGFCGFGDSCIYLHDRGDTLSGWQIEQQWQQEQEKKKQAQKEQMDAFLKGKEGRGKDVVVEEDGIPFACHLCREHFKGPVVTNCQHYFCQACLLEHISKSSLCPICNKDTHGVFHEPTKLISKKRKVSGRDSSWEEYREDCMNKSGGDDTENG